MPEFTYEHRVRYRECDPMGVVYHTHYLDYFEFARTEMLRSLGLSYREVEQRGIIMPVVDARVRYFQPAYYDDVLQVVARTNEHPLTVRLPIEYEVTRVRDTDVLAAGHTTLCFVDRKSGRPVRAPNYVRSCFE